MNEERLLELQTISYQIQQLQEQLQLIEEQFMELSVLSESLESLKHSKASDGLIPVGAGVFIEGAIKNTEKVILNVGSNVMVKKSIEDAKNLVEKQIHETREVAEQIKEEINHGLIELRKLEE
ncbi:MAG: prefoldin subunit alpha [Candidatus Nanoarchaeia archaeon]|nr:prefoldin subunit alpha [Candidatus Nanoarchaeia archaeon]